MSTQVSFHSVRGNDNQSDISGEGMVEIDQLDSCADQDDQVGEANKAAEAAIMTCCLVCRSREEDENVSSSSFSSGPSPSSPQH